MKKNFWRRGDNLPHVIIKEGHSRVVETINEIKK
jgi:hypothetical protein